MTDSVISIRNLSKSYLIGHDRPQERYQSFRDVLVRNGKNYVRKALDMARGKQIIQGDTVEEIWALMDVSFEVKRGEVLGIIGRNGAGKSTLLKILSRITEPTRGSVILRGRVASLLEVGTGFHPELSGRENIFLNGAILGMSRAEIKSKFDEIVDFAGVEKFLDTPVKRYSSGMYVRLAFAVAAHLEPEVLIIDEVLAVGDAEFQKKCLGKMQDVAHSGRTVLFVSHNMAQIQALCSTALLLQRGKTVQKGRPEQIIAHYYTEALNHSDKPIKSRFIRRISRSKVNDNPHLQFDDDLSIDIVLANLPLCQLGCNVTMIDTTGQRVFLFSTNPHDGIELPKLDHFTLTLTIPSCRLAPGKYGINIAFTEPGLAILEEIEGAYWLEVSPKVIGGTWPYMPNFGCYFPIHSWILAPSVHEVNS